LKSQIVISSWGGMRRAISYVFAEQGGILVVRSGEHFEAAGLSEYPAACVPRPRL
jgi:hypothetical protein